MVVCPSSSSSPELFDLMPASLIPGFVMQTGSHCSQNVAVHGQFLGSWIREIYSDFCRDQAMEKRAYGKMSVE
jgi:hypothetical protein